jgi:hypothetical protein
MQTLIKSQPNHQLGPKGSGPEQGITETEQRNRGPVLLRDKEKPGAVIRAEPFSHSWSIWFPTRFTLRAQQATGCILKFLDRLSSCEP